MSDLATALGVGAMWFALYKLYPKLSGSADAELPGCILLLAVLATCVILAPGMITVTHE